MAMNGMGGEWINYDVGMIYDGLGMKIMGLDVEGWGWIRSGVDGFGG